MELAALYAIAYQQPPDAAWLARIALDGRMPTEEGKQALADRIDVALYLDEMGA